jgi:hypothetical protein
MMPPVSYPHSPERYTADVARADEFLGRNALPALVRCGGCGSAWTGKDAAKKLAGHACIGRRNYAGGGVETGTST